MARYGARHGTIQFSDGAGTPNTWDLDVDNPDLNIDNLAANNREAIAAYHRDQFDGLMPGRDLEQNVTFTCQVKNRALTHASNDRFLDWVMKTNSASGYTSTDTTGGLEWAMKITLTLNDGTTSSTISLPVVRGTASFSESESGPHTFSFSGINYGAITRT